MEVQYSLTFQKRLSCAARGKASLNALNEQKTFKTSYVTFFTGLFLTVLGDAEGVGEGSGLVASEFSISSLKGSRLRLSLIINNSKAIKLCNKVM